MNVVRNLKNIFFTIWFFLNKRSKIIIAEIPSEILIAHLDIDPIKFVSDQIDIAKNSNLDQIDKFASTDNFWEGQYWPDKYSHLQYILKLGWLIKDIKETGASNPLQLLQSGNNKYIAHPGTARLLVLSYILPSDKVKIIYVWDTQLDPRPFILDYTYKEIRNPFIFLQQFKKNKNLLIKTTNLTENTICNDSTKYAYFSIAQKGLIKTHNTFCLDLISNIENSHWGTHIKHKVYFKDIITFYDNHCELGGVKFTKTNGLWISN